MSRQPQKKKAAGKIAPKSAPKAAAASGWQRRVIGISALALAILSFLIVLTVRDRTVVTAFLMFGTPWLVRLVLAGIALVAVRGKVARVTAGIVAAHALIQGGSSFHWRDEPLLKIPPTVSAAAAVGFDVTLWNCGHRLARMPDQWGQLAGPQTRLVVLIEAGEFPADVWVKFVEANPTFTWNPLEGGIVVGVRGTFGNSELFADLPKLRCHRISVGIDGRAYTVMACDIPSQPWELREPYLDRIRLVAKDRRCLILGDFNTPPDAVGYDAWRRDFVFGNEARTRGFAETWLYGLPVLTLDQLWLSHDLKCRGVEKHPGIHSDHARMVFRVAQAG